MAAAEKWRVYDSLKRDIGNGTMDMDTDAFRLTLHLSSYTVDTATHEVKANLTNEHATANGYPANGLALASVTYAESAGTVTFDSADPVFTAASGSIVARYAVIHDDTPTSPADPLVCYNLMDSAPADVTATDTNTLTIQHNASGIFTISGGDAA